MTTCLSEDFLVFSVPHTKGVFAFVSASLHLCIGFSSPSDGLRPRFLSETQVTVGLLPRFSAKFAGSKRVLVFIQKGFLCLFINTRNPFAFFFLVFIY